MASPQQTLPKTQRQWQQVRRGAPQDALELVQDAPVPLPRRGEVLVKIAYATPTPASWKLMRLFPAMLRRGAVPEMEASGRVADPNGSEFAVGDEVMGAINEVDHLKTGRGVLTQYALFKAEHLFRIPPNLNLQTAAGILVSGMTAYKALVEVADVKPGGRVFINGGTTASGIAGIQIAKILGATAIVVSCSAASFDLVKDLGATEAIDYKATPLTTQLATRFAADPFSAIYDCIGSRALYTASPAFLTRSGTYVTIALDVSGACAAAAFAVDAVRPGWLGGTPRRFALSTTPVARDRLVEPVRWAGEGRYRMLVDSVHRGDRDGVGAAYERGMGGRAKGKILICMDEAEEL